MQLGHRLPANSVRQAVCCGWGAGASRKWHRNDTRLSLVRWVPYWLYRGVPAARKKKPPLTEQDLSRWKLLADFQARLAAAGGAEPQGTFADPRRTLSQRDYLSLLLFGLFNPVVDSMRGLCAATALRRVQEDICTHPVSLGSFSEAQAAVAPELLQKVFAELAAEQQEFRGDPRLARYRDRLLTSTGRSGRRCPA